MLKSVNITAIVTFIIIFPLFLRFKAFFCYDAKRLYFRIKLLFLPVLTGDVTLTKEGIEIFKNGKTTVIKPKDLLKMNKTVAIFSDFHLISLHTRFDIGKKDEETSALATCFSLNLIICTLKKVFLAQKPYLDLKNKVNFYQDVDVFNVYIKSVIVFNLLTVILTLFVLLKEKIKNVSKGQSHKHGSRNRA